MSLIFAVDGDRKQSAALASLLRSHVNADLVQSGSANEGLKILQGRIPDLILTSSLLSPRDETALASHLRELGDEAAHVHTLTIPVIATAPSASRKKSQGVLGGLRREKDTRPNGCDPEVFAREVSLYLDRAVERRSTAAAVVPQAHNAVIEPVQALPDPEPITSREMETQALTDPVVVDAEPASPALPLDRLLELVVRNDEGRWVPNAAPADLPPVEPAVVVIDDAVSPEALAVADPGAVFPDVAEVAGFSPAELAQLSAPPRLGRAPDAVAAPGPPAPIVEMGTLEDLNLLETRFAASPQLGAAKPAATTMPGAGLAENAIAPSWPWVDDQAGVPLADVLLKACGPIEEVAVQPEPEPVPEPEPAPTLDLEALEFIGAAAHRAGLHALETLAEPATLAAPAERVDEAETEPVMRRPRERVAKPERKRKEKTARPAQDEWGLYDPAQAGPAALLDDEDWEDEPDPPRQAGRPRATVY